jgi:hypothetical protein
MLDEFTKNRAVETAAITVKDLLSEKDYKIFLKDLADLTLMKDTLLNKLEYPVDLVIKGHKYSDFGLKGGYIINLGGYRTTWSAVSGFDTRKCEEVAKSLAIILQP